MIIIPAIDIIDGQAVRLYKGDYGTMEKVAENIVETAIEFEKAGAEFIHLVDLDGAKVGNLVNIDVILKVADTVKSKVEVGGGIRTIESIERLIEGGVERVILGTSAIEDESLLKRAISLYGDKIAVGVDCKDGYPCGRGWLTESKVNYIDFCKQLEKLGVKNIILTDISKDGTLEGPNVEMLSSLKREVKVDITASGGIRDIDNIRDLNELNLYGAITGKAIYTKSLDLKEAIFLTKNKGE